MFCLLALLFFFAKRGGGGAEGGVNQVAPVNAEACLGYRNSLIIIVKSRIGKIYYQYVACCISLALAFKGRGERGREGIILKFETEV